MASAYLPGLAQDQGAAWAYYLPDALGSVRQLTDAGAQVTLARSYEPFGSLLEQAGMGSSGFGFAGEQEDASTGLVFLRARYYDPVTGRFISKDPWAGTVIRPDTMQGYSYTANNPVRHRDPSGRDYVPSWDRYTCDDPHASGGYVYHYDQATGTWGGWPCLVYNYQDAIPVGAPGYPYPDPYSEPPSGQPEQHSPVTPPTTAPAERTTARLQTFAQLSNVTGVTGYLEGWAVSGTALTCNLLVVGQEIVYDFYTGQRAVFNFIGQPYEGAPIPFPAGESIPTLADISGSGHAGFIWGFDREPVGDLVREYRGPFVVGFGTGQFPIPVTAGIGTINGTANLFSSTSGDWYGWRPNRDVYGISFGAGAGAGSGVWDLPVSVGAIRTNYSLDYELLPYKYRDDMAQDIRDGVGVPAASNWLLSAIDYVIEYRSLAADVAKTASPDAEWVRWK